MAMKTAAGVANDIICRLGWRLGRATLAVISSGLPQFASPHISRLDSAFWLAAAAVFHGAQETTGRTVVMLYTAWRMVDEACCQKADLDTYLLLLMAYK